MKTKIKSELKLVESEGLTPKLKLKIFDEMVKARVLEERLIKMNKAGMGFFWIGGPGEEAFNIPLGHLIHKGEGLDFDYLHFHYRQAATMLAMGMTIIDPIRQMHSVATDPFSGGRNFGNHFSVKQWNVCPISSCIEVQYAIAIGTGVAQKRHGGDGITIVTGGDAGTAEGEFSSCMVWASRQNRELPILMIVTNNSWGISTPAKDVQPAASIAKRAEGYGIKNVIVDGTDVEASYQALQEAMSYVRSQRKPFLIEARVSRLYGHSSASGANFVTGELDCLDRFEKELIKAGITKKGLSQELRKKYVDETKAALKQVLGEPKPDPKTIFDHVFENKEEALQPWPRWLKR